MSGKSGASFDITANLNISTKNAQEKLLKLDEQIQKIGKNTLKLSIDNEALSNLKNTIQDIFKSLNDQKLNFSSLKSSDINTLTSYVSILTQLKSLGKIKILDDDGNTTNFIDSFKNKGLGEFQKSIKNILNLSDQNFKLDINNIDQIIDQINSKIKVLNATCNQAIEQISLDKNIIENALKTFTNIRAENKGKSYTEYGNETAEQLYLSTEIIKKAFAESSITLQGLEAQYGKELTKNFRNQLNTKSTTSNGIISGLNIISDGVFKNYSSSISSLTETSSTSIDELQQNIVAKLNNAGNNIQQVGNEVIAKEKLIGKEIATALNQKVEGSVTTNITENTSNVSKTLSEQNTKINPNIDFSNVEKLKNELNEISEKVIEINKTSLYINISGFLKKLTTAKSSVLELIKNIENIPAISTTTSSISTTQPKKQEALQTEQIPKIKPTTNTSNIKSLKIELDEILAKIEIINKTPINIISELNLENAVSKLNIFDEQVKTLKASVQNISINPTIKNIDFSENIKSIGNNLENLKINIDFSGLNKLKDELNEISAKINNINNIAIDIIPKINFEDAFNGINSLNEKINTIKASIQNLSIVAPIQSNNSISTSGQVNQNIEVKPIVDFSNIENLKKELDIVSSKIANIKENTITITPILSFEDAFAKIKDFNEQIKILKAQINQSLEIKPIVDFSNIENLKKELDIVSSKIANIKENTITITPEINLKDSINTLNSFNNQIEKLKSSLQTAFLVQPIQNIEISTEAVSKLKQQLSNIPISLNIKTNEDTILKNLTDSINSITPNITKFNADSAISTLKGQIEAQLKELNLNFVVRAIAEAPTQTSSLENSQFLNSMPELTTILNEYEALNNLIRDAKNNSNDYDEAIKNSTANIDKLKNNLSQSNDISKEMVKYLDTLASNKITNKSSAMLVDSNLKRSQKEAIYNEYYKHANALTVGTSSNNNKFIEILKGRLSNLNSEILKTKKELENLAKTNTHINFESNINEFSTLSTQCTNAIKELSSSTENINVEQINKFKTALQEIRNNFNNSNLKSQGITSAISQINELQIKIEELAQNNSFQTITRKFKLNESFGSLSNDIKNINYSNLENLGSIVGSLKLRFEELTAQVDNFKSLDKITSQFEKAKKVAVSLNNAKTKLSNNNQKELNANGMLVDNPSQSVYQQILDVQNKLNIATSQYDEILSKINNDGSAFNDERDKILQLRSEIEKLTQQATTLKTATESLGNLPKTVSSQDKLETKYSKLIADITKFKNDNGKALTNGNYAYQLDSIIKEASNTTRSSSNLSNLQTRFTNLKSEIIETGKAGRSVAQEIDLLFSKIGIKAILGTAFYRVISYFKTMLSNVKELDTGMVNLRRVTNETEEAYSNFLTTSATKAKELATTMTDFIDTSASFSRLGYSLEESIKLGDIATMYNNVGFIDDIEVATSDIVTAMKAFDIGADDAISIIDAYDKLGNEFAVSSKQIGEGITRSASALAVAGNNINQSIAMITGGTEITQDAESMGNAMKTLSMRIRGMKTELEEAGEETDGMVTSTAKLEQSIKALTGVEIMQDKDTFRSTYDILNDIASVWDDLTDANRASVLEQIAGKTRANQVASLISNWETVQRAYESANNSSGTAVEENQKIVDSLEGRLTILKSTSQEMASVTFDTETLKYAVELLTKLSSGITEIIKAIGGVPTLISSIGIAYGLLDKKFGTIGFTSDKLNAIYNNIKNSTNKANSQTAINTNSISYRETATDVTSTVGIDKRLEQINSLHKATRKLIDLNNSSYKGLTFGIDDTSDAKIEQIISNYNKLLPLQKDALSYGKAMAEYQQKKAQNPKDTTIVEPQMSQILKDNGISEKSALSFATYAENVDGATSALNKYLSTCRLMNKEASYDGYMTFLQNSGYGKGLSGTLKVLEDYNSLASNVVGKDAEMTTSQKEFLSVLQRSNPVLAQNIQSINRATVGVGQLAGSYALATVKTKALALASATLNAVVGGLISVLAMQLVSALINLFKNWGKISEQVKENCENFENLTKKTDDYIQKLKQLKEEQAKAIDSKNTQDNLEANNELISLQEELINTYKDQVDGISLVNGSLEEQLKIVQQIVAENGKSLIDNYDNQKGLNKAYSKIEKNNTIKIDGFSADTDLIEELSEIINEDFNNAVMKKYQNSEHDYEIALNLKGMSVSEAQSELKKLYSTVETLSNKYNTTSKSTLKSITDETENFESEKYQDYLSLISDMQSAYLDQYQDENNNYVFQDYQNQIDKLKSQYNDYISQNLTDDANEVYNQILDLYQEIKNQPITDDSGKFEKIFPNVQEYQKVIDSWFSGVLDSADAKVIDFIENDAQKLSLLKETLGKTNIDLKLQISKDDYSGLSNLKSLANACGISIEDLIDILTNLGIVSSDTSTKASKAIDEVKTSLNDVMSSYNIESSDDSSISDILSTITTAYDDIAQKGTITTANLLNLYANGFGNAVKYNSEADVFNLDREELEKLTKAKYNDITASLKQQRIQLSAKQYSAQKEISLETNPEKKAKLQSIYNENNYDEAISLLDMTIKSVTDDYNNFINSISNTKIDTSSIETLDDIFSSMSSIFEKIEKNETLSANDIATVVDNGFGDTLKIENGLVTINEEKYKELAEAKIQAYKVDTQDTLNNLQNEQLKLSNLITSYTNTLNSGDASSYSKAYASQQINELTKDYENNAQSIIEYESTLAMYDDLSSKILSTTNGTYSDILSGTSSIESAISSMNSAFSEMKENGSLSINTAMGLIDSGYAECLMLNDTADGLTLNANKFKELAKAKIQAQIVSLKSIQTTGQETAQIQAQIDALTALANNLDMVTVGAYNSGTDYYKEEAEAQFAELEHLHNMNVIDDEHYYDYMNQLNEEYYANKIEYLDDYRSYEEKIYQGMIAQQKELIDTQKSALEANKKAYESQKNDIQNQIDAIEDEKDYWNKQKEAIQDQIDALKDKNEEEERTLALQEAQLKLQNALNQKTVRVFTEELGWSWEANQNDIKDAEKDVKDAELDIQVAELEKQQDAIDDIIDGLDDQIDNLKDQQDNIDKMIDSINDQIDVLEEQQQALEEQQQLNANHTNELTGLKDSVNSFTKITQENLNKLLGLPENFNSSANTVSASANELKTSIDTSNSNLSELKQQMTLGAIVTGGAGRIAQTLTVNIDTVKTNDGIDFVSQLTNCLKEQM